MDIYPTLSELAGFEDPESVQGKSLVPVLQDNSAHVREAALTIDRSGYALRSDRWSYIRYNDDTEEFYDMQSDPGQLTNLAINPEREDELKTWRSKLDSRLKGAGITRKLKKG